MGLSDFHDLGSSCNLQIGIVGNAYHRYGLERRDLLLSHKNAQSVVVVATHLEASFVQFSMSA